MPTAARLPAQVPRVIWGCGSSHATSAVHEPSASAGSAEASHSGQPPGSQARPVAPRARRPGRGGATAVGMGQRIVCEMVRRTTRAGDSWYVGHVANPDGGWTRLVMFFSEFTHQRRRRGRREFRTSRGRGPLAPQPVRGGAAAFTDPSGGAGAEGSHLRGTDNRRAR